MLAYHIAKRHPVDGTKRMVAHHDTGLAHGRQVLLALYIDRHAQIFDDSTAEIHSYPALTQVTVDEILVDEPLYQPGQATWYKPSALASLLADNLVYINLNDGTFLFRHNSLLPKAGHTAVRPPHHLTATGRLLMK